MRKQAARRGERYIGIMTESDKRGARHIVNAISVQVAMMEARGYSKKQQNDYVFKVLRDLEKGRMNEGLLDTLGGLLGWASDKKYLQPIQNWMGKKVANMLGLTEGSIFYRVVVNFIENLEISKVQQMFSGGGACRPLVSELAGSVQEALVEQGVAALGLEPTGVFGTIIQESLQAAFVEEGLFVNKITDMVCSLDVSDFFGGGKADVKAAITGAEPAPA